MRKTNDHKEVLLLRIVWGLVTDGKEMWIRVLKAKYKWNGENPWDNFNGRKGSSLWRSIARIWHLVVG